MNPKIQLLLLFCLLTLTASAQKDTSATFAKAKKDTSFMCNIGDYAPPLRVREWIKGTPVPGFEKGKMYVVEFWATWCAPCVASMPHLSGLARKYKSKVTFSAVSVHEDRETKGNTPEKLRAFVGAMGNKMDFNVASEDTNSTVKDWLRDYNQQYIPTTFVVDRQGRIAWIGDPLSLDTALKKIIKNTWDIEIESSKRRLADSTENYLGNLDDSLPSKVRRYQGKYTDLNDMGLPDSTLMVIDEMVKMEPKLKYAPEIARYTFTALLRTDPHKAYEFGKQAIASSYKWYAYGSIIDDIREDVRKLNTPTKEIYLLGAECCKAKIDRSPAYALPSDMAKIYQEMADWYRHGGDKLSAIAAEKKAIKLWEKDLKNSLNQK